MRVIQLVKVNGDRSNARLNHSLTLLQIRTDMGLKALCCSKRHGRPANKVVAAEAMAIRKLANDIYY